MAQGTDDFGNQDPPEGLTGDPNVIEETDFIRDSGYLPPLLGPSIPHYYGDYVRQLFVLAAGIIVVAIPFFASEHPIALPFELGGALTLIVLAALTNPHKQWVMMANVIAAGIGVALYEVFALWSYTAREFLVFIEREILVLILLIALYYSVKTLRAMFLGQTGRKNTVGEFLDR